MVLRWHEDWYTSYTYTRLFVYRLDIIMMNRNQIQECWFRVNVYVWSGVISST